MSSACIPSLEISINPVLLYFYFAFLGEIGGPKGPEPTRFGDWERKGRVTDF